MNTNPGPGLGSPHPASANAHTNTAPAATGTAGLKPEITGTRRDLASFLRRQRRTLKLVLFDVWGDTELPTHTFFSRLDRSPFGGRTRFLDFQIFPF